MRLQDKAGVVAAVHLQRELALHPGLEGAGHDDVPLRRRQRVERERHLLRRRGLVLGLAARRDHVSTQRVGERLPLLAEEHDQSDRQHRAPWRLRDGHIESALARRHERKLRVAPPVRVVALWAAARERSLPLAGHLLPWHAGCSGAYPRRLELRGRAFRASANASSPDDFVVRGGTKKRSFSVAARYTALSCCGSCCDKFYFRQNTACTDTTLHRAVEHKCIQTGTKSIKSPAL